MELQQHNKTPKPEKPHGVLSRFLGRLGMTKTPRVAEATKYETLYGRYDLEDSTVRQQEAAHRAAANPPAPGQRTEAELRNIVGTNAWRKAHFPEEQQRVSGTVDHPVIGHEGWQQRIGESAGQTWPAPETTSTPNTISGSMGEPNVFEQDRQEALRQAALPVIGRDPGRH